MPINPTKIIRILENRNPASKTEELQVHKSQLTAHD